ncbi:DUF4350 domain-containing protein [Sphingomonas naphthae]|uniref:DUF4350 domain-containing protein n=1 Tax=Sphingomonas naphthae TaxID=1813468 RepID=A0ABY7TR84_9SPHN|nr:DUF4350 domain-containing protein [Sphingomonas naphthae]WCT74890.1 DUF4350 domain-containing protein [Sphingomonas naphthae]
MTGTVAPTRRSRAMRLPLLASLFLATAAPGQQPTQQQAADPQADTSVAHPAYPAAQGPLVAIDQGHGEFHTLAGRYAPFAAVLRADGYRLAAIETPLSAETLTGVSVLVIANATARGSWQPAEIDAVHRWVEGGGSLLLIADHMPFGAATNPLAERFGIHFDNGFAFQKNRGPESFTRRNGLLLDGPLTAAHGHQKAIDEVYAFTGTAFTAPPSATIVMRLGPGWSILSPAIPWQFDGAPSRPSTEADLRGAILDIGKGRLAVFGEAAMFTAQRSVRGGTMGFNYPKATKNKAFLLNTLHWLSRTG